VLAGRDDFLFYMKGLTVAEAFRGTVQVRALDARRDDDCRLGGLMGKMLK
jgi:hypothetical protein